tara:strand:- start:2452 stop:2733 length:282 start_codon:yes stop_codon:yes gene_type:complete
MIARANAALCLSPPESSGGELLIYGTGQPSSKAPLNLHYLTKNSDPKPLSVVLYYHSRLSDPKIDNPDGQRQFFSLNKPFHRGLNLKTLYQRS